MIAADPIHAATMSATDALFARAFSTSATITAKAAAALLGMDVKTLSQMTDSGLIKFVWRGKLRAYTEADLRAFLAASIAAAPKEDKPDTVVPFTTMRKRGANSGRGRLQKAPTFSARLAAKNRA